MTYEKAKTYALDFLILCIIIDILISNKLASSLALVTVLAFKIVTDFFKNKERKENDAHAKELKSQFEKIHERLLKVELKNGFVPKK